GPAVTVMCRMTIRRTRLGCRGAGVRRPGPTRALRLLAAGLVAAVPLLAAPRAGAQEQPGDGRPGELSGATAIADTTGADLLRSTRDAPAGTVAEIDAHVTAQVAALGKARTARTQARADLQAADAALAKTRARIASLDTRSDQVVIDAFVDPPDMSTLDA